MTGTDRTAWKLDDHIRKQLSDYEAMRAKAKAWDELRLHYESVCGMVHTGEVLAAMNALMWPQPLDH